MSLARFFFAASAALFFCLPAQAASQKLIADCMRAEDSDRAIAACDNLLKDNQFVKVGNNRVAILNNLANQYNVKGDYDQAIAYSTKALQINPKSAGTLSLRGYAWFKKGENAKAQADLDEAINLEPKRAKTIAMRATFFSNIGELDKAVADYSEAIRLQKIPSDLATTYNNRALAWRDKGDLDHALADFDRAISSNSKFHLAYANRGEIWRLKGDLDRALVDQSTSIRLEQHNPTAYVLRGDTFRYKGDFPHALADYDSALRELPNFIAAFVGRGLTYEKMGELANAGTEYKKALSSNDQLRTDLNKPALETAQARLAAFDSGATQPVIMTAPSKVTSQTSLPTPAITVPLQPVKASTIAGRRVALVVGNSTYANVPALANPEKDASAIAATLRNIGFDVVLITNVTHEQMVKSLRDFANDAEKADWAMVYYAGHGMEVGGVNYLIPIDAKIAVDRDIQYEAVPLNQVLNSADAAKKIKLIMLDACRDNPFIPRRTAAPEQVAQSTAGAPITTRSTNGRGLAEVKVAGATLVVYAAKDGQVALDGEGSNSPFAVAVIQRIATPGVEINKLFRLVRDDVMEATAGRQEPYTYGSLPGKEDFFFVAK